MIRAGLSYRGEARYSVTRTLTEEVAVNALNETDAILVAQEMSADEWERTATLVDCQYDAVRE